MLGLPLLGRRKAGSTKTPAPINPLDVKGSFGFDNRGWDAYGIPSASGDGFEYNREWAIADRPGRAISEQGILQLAAAMACVRLLSSTIATLPLGIYRTLPDGGRKAQPGHRLYELLHNQPNPDMSAVDFWQVMVSWMLLRGNAIAEKNFVGDQLVSLDPIPLTRASWRYLIDGSLEYTIVDIWGKYRVLSEDKIWHLPAFTLDGRTGLSPIFYGSGVFGGAMSAEDAAQSFFNSGMSAAGYVTTPPGLWLKKDQRQEMKASLQEFSGAKNAGKSMILEGGMGYSQMTLNPSDSQLLETRKFHIDEICRWFGVPPTLIGHGERYSNWGTGLEQQTQSFLTFCLRPWLSKIEQSIRRSLMAPADKPRYTAEFSVEGLLRADSAARATFYSAMVNNGLWTRDEVRVKENMPQKGGNADVLTVQSAMFPLDKIGTVTPGAPLPAEPTAIPPKPADPTEVPT
jgi:HK97 family phage portal protein